MDTDAIFTLSLFAIPILLNIFGMPDWLSSFLWNFANLFAIAGFVMLLFFPELNESFWGEGGASGTDILLLAGIYIACSIRGIIRIKINYGIYTFMDKVMLLLNIPCLVACFAFGFTLKEMLRGSGLSKASSKRVKVTTDSIGRAIVVDSEGNEIDKVDSYDWDGNVRGRSGEKYMKK